MAASYRIMPHAVRVQAPVKVKVAAILSLGAKLNLRDAKEALVDNEGLRKLWCHVASARNIENIKAVEQSIFKRLVLDGLEGPYAEEKLGMLAEVS